MSNKMTKSTKGKIVDAAWKLFYEYGYEDTTIDAIVEESGTSKGSFYHYFDSKDALLGSLAYLFDEKYEELALVLDDSANALDTLYWLNRELFNMIENRIDISLLTRLYSSQLTTKGGKELLDRNRMYFRLLRKIVLAGQERGEITPNKTASEIVRLYSLCERALLYDWCLCGGEYSLSEYASSVLPLFLGNLGNYGK